MEESLMKSATTTNEGETSAVTQDLASEATETSTTTEATTTETTAAEGAPETYEFKAPEGQEYDPEVTKAFAEVAKEINLSQDKAQAMLDKMSPIIQQQTQARIEAVRNEWAEASKVDKEFGGDKLKENLAVAKTALDKFGTPELKDLINKSGLGNNPEMIRFFYRAGKAITPDIVVTGHKEGKIGGKTFNDMAETLYS